MVRLELGKMNEAADLAIQTSSLGTKTAEMDDCIQAENPVT